MKTVKMFKCSYCDKMHDDKNECIDHEKECVENTKMKSCRNCVFYRMSTLKFEPRDSVSIPTCLRNIDINEGLVLNCDNYLALNATFGSDILTQTEKSYDPYSTFKMQIEELFPNNEMIKRYSKVPF